MGQALARFGDGTAGRTWAPARVLGYTVVAMRRSAALVAVLIAMLWQSVALARPGSTVNVLADLNHAAMHWQGEAHHHDDDGSLHMDDSPASTFHLLADHVSLTAALLPASAQHVAPPAFARPGWWQDARTSDPFLDGLLRPPRLLA